jgi:acylphosphatase
MEHARVHLEITGVVQGVGFRFFVVHWARHLGLTGWVRNRGDGSVEVMAEGEQGMLNDFVKKMHVGPVAAHVRAVNATPLDARGEYQAFEVRY